MKKLQKRGELRKIDSGIWNPKIDLAVECADEMNLKEVSNSDGEERAQFDGFT